MGSLLFVWLFIPSNAVWQQIYLLTVAHTMACYLICTKPLPVPMLTQVYWYPPQCNFTDKICRQNIYNLIWKDFYPFARGQWFNWVFSLTTRNETQLTLCTGKLTDQQFPYTEVQWCKNCSQLEFIGEPLINSLRPSDAYMRQKLTIIGSDNGLSPERHQANIWTNAGILLIGTLGTNFCEILSEIHTFSFKKMLLKTSSVKWRPFCLSLNVLILHSQISACWWNIITMWAFVIRYGWASLNSVIYLYIIIRLSPSKSVPCILQWVTWYFLLLVSLPYETSQQACLSMSFVQNENVSLSGHKWK